MLAHAVPSGHEVETETRWNKHKRIPYVSMCLILLYDVWCRKFTDVSVIFFLQRIAKDKKPHKCTAQRKLKNANLHTWILDLYQNLSNFDQNRTQRQLFQALAELHLQHAPFAKTTKEVQQCSKAPRAGQNDDGKCYAKGCNSYKKYLASWFPRKLSRKRTTYWCKHLAELNMLAFNYKII